MSNYRVVPMRKRMQKDLAPSSVSAIGWFPQYRTATQWRTYADAPAYGYPTEAEAQEHIVRYHGRPR